MRVGENGLSSAKKDVRFKNINNKTNVDVKKEKEVKSV